MLHRLRINARRLCVSADSYTHAAEAVYYTSGDGLPVPQHCTRRRGVLYVASNACASPTEEPSTADSQALQHCP